MRISAGTGSDEPLGNTVLIPGIGFEASWSCLGFDSFAGSAGELAAGRRAASDDLRHGGEGELEGIVQHEHGALSGGELLEDDEQGHADAVV